ncbi:UNVERIFIED_CONTAM: LINE-1 retrotransposable element O protein [Sesamum latifolium]|uniref:LINE-1 retrotransposable element O protein n=1 Tax=Sesamum latifolium TaxID=2727402 RepID=A0AAW2S1Z9_9LAMI
MINAAIWNVRGLNRRDPQVSVANLVSEYRLQFIGLLETRVSIGNVARVQRGLLPRWSWFVDYVSPGNRIWLAWGEDFIDLNVLKTGDQFVHCSAHIRCLHVHVLITVVYGVNDVVGRRVLWDDLDCISHTGTFGVQLRSSMAAYGTPVSLPCLCGGSGLLGITVVGTPGAFESGWIASWSMTGGWDVSRTRIMSAFMPGLLITRPWFSVVITRVSLLAQRQNRGDLSNNVKLAVGFLEAAQHLLAQDRHSGIFLHLEFCCKLVLWLASRLEQHMLHQRAKIAWMKGGDQCSHVFFRKIAKRRSSKRVYQITNSVGQVLTSQPAVTNEFITYYQTLLGGSQRDRLLDLRYLRPWARHILLEEEARSLLLPVTADEIKQAVFYIDEIKAPGPDGYSSSFFKAAWPIVGREVTKAIMDFFATGRLLKQVNSTLISLIPKVNNPTVVAEFRPISCCNVLYKHLPPRCALKVDLWKAYDMVEWDFLPAVLILFGFPKQFIGWIVECVTTPSFSVCLNGSPHGYFRGARGLRQGDPMSPYLFVLVMEVLSLILRQANLHKSHLILSRSAAPLRDTLLAILDFQEGHLPLWYLGLPLLASRLSVADCQPILQKIDGRIRGWDGIMLSFAGRVQLIKSVLSALQVYWAMAFILPKHVIKEIEKSLRSFLWKGNTDGGSAKVSWQQVCRPVSEGD